MPDPKTITPKVESRLLPAPQWSSVRRQQRFMVVALALLLGALSIILYRDRDFWFPDPEQVADTAPQQSPPVSTPKSEQAWTPVKTSKVHTAKASHQKPVEAPPVQPIMISARTVLPPLEVEVVAGDSHQNVRSGSNSVRVDLQSGSTARAVTKPPLEIHTDPPAITTNAAELARVSTTNTSLIAESVRPDYPMLARQMKVQGSVILQALIGRDGLIQDLRVLSGPPILAAAAREAVRQWHFKPHYLGNEAVETETRITVNFTISTN